MDEKWPIVLKNDEGIRPAGNPDECFYCKSKVGELHKKDCVIVTKIVKVKYTFEIEICVPHSWDQDQINFHRNESSWCASNAIDDLVEFDNKVGCLCPYFEAEYIEVVDNTPVRLTKEEANQKIQETSS
jgi:hypothetical protein